MRRYWRELEFWRWWWENRVRRDFKVSLLVLLLGVFAAGGYALAAEASEEPTTALVTTERVLTVVRSRDGKTVTNVLTETDTTTRSSTETETDLVTLTRDGETVVIQRPGRTMTDTETRTVRGPVREKVVTDTETVDRETTVTNTRTVDRTTTETRPGQTVSVTEPGKTETETVTHEITVTETETETVTVTGKKPP